MIRALYTPVVHDDGDRRPVLILKCYESGNVLLAAADGEVFVASWETLSDVEAEELLDVVFVRWLRHTLLCKPCFKSYPEGAGCDEGRRLKTAWATEEMRP